LEIVTFSTRMERFFFMKSSGQFSIVHCPAKMRDSNQTGDFVLSAIKPVGNQEYWNDGIILNIVEGCILRVMDSTVKNVLDVLY